MYLLSFHFSLLQPSVVFVCLRCVSAAMLPPLPTHGQQLKVRDQGGWGMGITLGKVGTANVRKGVFLSHLFGTAQKFYHCSAELVFYQNISASKRNIF